VYVVAEMWGNGNDNWADRPRKPIVWTRATPTADLYHSLRNFLYRTHARIPGADGRLVSPPLTVFRPKRFVLPAKLDYGLGRCAGESGRGQSRASRDCTRNILVVGDRSQFGSMYGHVCHYKRIS